MFARPLAHLPQPSGALLGFARSHEARQNLARHLRQCRALFCCNVVAGNESEDRHLRAVVAPDFGDADCCKDWKARQAGTRDVNLDDEVGRWVIFFTLFEPR